MSRRIPSFVLKRNRQAGYAEEQAQGYREPHRIVYLVDAGDGRGPLEVDLREWCRSKIEELTPRDHRLIRELQPNEAMDVAGVTLHCVRAPLCEFCGGRFTEENPNAGLASRDYHAGCNKAPEVLQ